MHNRFRAGRSVFTCGICGRRTRESGQSLGAECCFECYELAGLQNSIYDSVGTIADIAPERDRLLRVAVERGGDEAKIRAEFDNLWD